MPDYSTYDEERLIQLAKEKDQMALQQLLSNYQGLISQIALSFYLLTGDYDDLAQEGRLGFLSAIENYDKSRGDFTDFSMLCVRRAMYRAMQAAGRKKHAPLNESISYDAEGGEEMLSASVDGQAMNPEYALLDQEKATELLLSLDRELSSLEKKVLELMLEGAGYKHIAKTLGITDKQADNAIQRIRNKTRKLQKRG